MGDPPPRKRLKIACGDAKIAISVLATCSVKDACKAAEEAFERKDMLKKRKVRTFMLMPDEIELDELELVVDVVEDELLQPIFEDDADDIKNETAEHAPSSAACPLLELTFVLASAPSDCPKIVRAHGFAAIRAAIVSKCVGGGGFQQGVAVGLFTFNGIELPAIEVDGCEIISDFLAEIQANGGEGSRRTPTLWVVVGDVQGCKQTSERFGLTEAWQPEVLQTDKAISSFLATLSVVTAHAPKKVSLFLCARTGQWQLWGALLRGCKLPRQLTCGCKLISFVLSFTSNLFPGFPHYAPPLSMGDSDTSKNEKRNTNTNMDNLHSIYVQHAYLIKYTKLLIYSRVHIY